MMDLAALAVLLATVLAQGQGLTIQLSQVDFTVNSDQSAFQDQVLLSGMSTGPTQAEILPLTFDQYAELFPDSDGPCTVPTGARAATSEDFNQTVIQLEIPADLTGANTQMQFEVGLTPNGPVEAEESFLLLLNVTGGEGELGSRACSIVKIGRTIPTTTTYIQLDNERNIEIIESSGTLTFTITKLVESELPIRISISSIGRSAREGTDFTLPVTELEILPEQSQIEYNVTILDDELVEGNEDFSLTVAASFVGIAFVSQRLETSVTIFDDDVIQIGFEEDTIDVFEGGEGEFCARIINESVVFDYFEPFPLSLSGTATRNVDFTLMSLRRYVPSRASRRSCYPFRAINNNDTQPLRFFTVSFDTSQETQLIRIDPSSVRINIHDDDGIPAPPEILRADPDEDKTVLVVDWDAESTRPAPITSFTVIIRVGGSEEEFPISNSSSRTFTLKDYQDKDEYEILVCANNFDKQACSNPVTVLATATTTTEAATSTEATTTEVATTTEATTTAAPTTEATTTAAATTTTSKPNILFVDTPDPFRGQNNSNLPPGLIAGIVVLVVAAILVCCLFCLILICLCFCRRPYSQKAYYPGKAKGKELRGASSVPDNKYYDSDSLSYKEDDDSSYYSPPPPKVP